jgi:hypothetical protein
MHVHAVGPRSLPLMVMRTSSPSRKLLQGMKLPASGSLFPFMGESPLMLVPFPMVFGPGHPV